MSTVIKAESSNGIAGSVAFNFDDMAARANAYLDKVRAEAAAIVAQARRDAAAVRREAEKEGRQAGQQAIEEMVEQQLAAKLATLLRALQDAVADIRQAKQAWLTHWEKCGVHVAAAIASRLIRRELSLTPEITLDLVREALELAAGSPQVRIRLSPTDYKTLGGQVRTLAEELSSLGATDIVPDTQITPGGCRVETRFGMIDQQIETQLQRIEEELTC